LDGYCVEKGVIRQFVAMPLGQGFSVEEQITGEAEHGGLQIVAYPMKAEVAEKLRRPSTVLRLPSGLSETKTMFRKVSDADMGLAPGGRMIQDIHDDPYGMAAWDLRHSARCFVTIANTEAWQEISGEAPPTQPPSAKSYNEAGLPWFEHYDADPKPVRGSDRLAGLKSWFRMGGASTVASADANVSLAVGKKVKVGYAPSSAVREASI
jgi:hypothetical protein